MTGPRWSALAAAIDGEVDLRGSPEHARRARAFNARFDHLEPEADQRQYPDHDWAIHQGDCPRP